MLYAQVTDALVANLIVWDGEDAEFARSLLPSALHKVPPDQSVSVGDTFDGVNFMPAVRSASTLPPPVPASVTMAQWRCALIAGGLLEAAQAAVAVLDGIDGQMTRARWEFDTTVSRASAWVGDLAKALELDEAAIDTLFIEASQL